MPDSVNDEDGPIYWLWLAIRPSMAEPPGLGMAWEDAIRRSPQQLQFMLASHDDIRGLQANIRMRQNEASGITRKMASEDFAEWRRKKRMHFTGKTTRD